MDYSCWNKISIHISHVNQEHGGNILFRRRLQLDYDLQTIDIVTEMEKWLQRPLCSQWMHLRWSQ